MQRLALLLALPLLSACPPPGGTDAGALDVRHPLDDVLRLNHVLVKGTHNSYHRRPQEIVADPWDYEHAPLDVQLGDQGVRQFELDASFDDETGEFRVFHIATFDPETTCPTLPECLQTVAAWSDAHPGHVPITIVVEPKNADDDVAVPDKDRYLERLEEVVTEGLGEERLIRPLDVKGDYATLQEAVAAEGWPTLGEVRGKVLVVLFDEGDIVSRYAHGDTHLDDRAMFVRGRTEYGFGVFIKVDDPDAEGALDEIADAVDRGILVRTRSDSDGNEARENDTARRDLALASGAHMVSTDFPVPHEDTGFVVDIPGGTPAGCNPRTAPAGCTPDAVEDPERLTGR